LRGGRSFGIALDAYLERSVDVDLEKVWDPAAGVIAIGAFVRRGIEDDSNPVFRENVADEGHRGIEILAILLVVPRLFREEFAQHIRFEHGRSHASSLVAVRAP
jgi:hypothetical protein